MPNCPYCGHYLTDDELSDLRKRQAKKAGSKTSEAKRKSSADNAKKAFAAITPERRAEILAKARAARQAKLAANKSQKEPAMQHKVSLNNGTSFVSVSDLTDIQVKQVLDDINTANTDERVAAAVNDLSGCGDNDREWLTMFLDKIDNDWIIG